MSLITLPFAERMKQAILSGQKCCTTRYSKKGDPGDWFFVGGEAFRILDVQLAPLPMVRDIFYRLEGCSSPDDFECLWRSLHGGAFPPLQACWVHFFVRFPIPAEIIAADTEAAREADRVASEDREAV